MIVMPANVTSPEVRGLMHEYPGLLGNLFSPGAWQTPHGVYALDNGRFSARGADWSERDWLKLIDKAAGHPRRPEWVLCPDVVGNWKATMKDWDRWNGRLRATGWGVAVAVQDGATPEEVAAMSPNVVFVGGTTGWKLRTMQMWCKTFPRVHVARVNTEERAMSCFDAGAESIDGTGWMRTTRQRKLLRSTLNMMAGRSPRPLLLWEGIWS